MRHKPAPLTTITLLFLAFLIMGLSPLEQAMAAPACPSAGSISNQQRKALANLPQNLQTILQAVKRKNQTSCQAPRPDLISNTAIDPLSIPLNLSALSPTNETRRVPDEVVATINGDGRNIETIARNNGLTVRRRRRSALLGGFVVRFGITDGRSPSVVALSLQASGTVDTPGPNHLYRLQSSAFDESRFAPRKIGWPKANSKLTGKNILIGVIDTAIDPDHPDLKDAVVDSFDALAGQPVINRHHGTAVAGLIAGRSMIKGVAPKARLLIARAFDTPSSANAKASATSYQLLEALDWIVGKGARIINMSFTGPRNTLMSKALAAAAQKNVLLIAAAGNNGPQAPAAYPAAEQSVLAVTATDVDNRIYTEANVGRYVFVAAPGVDVLAAAPDKGVDMVSGTSFAAPFLSGLAALMLEQNTTMTPRQFAKRIELSSQDLGQPGRDEVFGVGLANLGKALAQK